MKRSDALFRFYRRPLFTAVGGHKLNNTRGVATRTSFLPVCPIHHVPTFQLCSTPRLAHFLPLLTFAHFPIFRSDTYDVTPLHVACRQTHVRLVDELLRWGADENAIEVDSDEDHVSDQDAAVSTLQEFSTVGN